MTDTPETDNLARGNHVVPTEFAEKLERERDEARGQRDRLLEQQEQWRLSSVCRELVEQRDRLANVLQNIRSGYGGQIPDPDCYCGDCEFLINIDTVLRFLTQNEP